MTEGNGTYKTLAVVIRTTGNIGAAGSTDYLHLDTEGRIHYVSNQVHHGTSTNSTRRADVESMIRAARVAGVSNVVMDLSRWTWINSSGLGELVLWYHEIKTAGGDMVITGASEQVLNLLSITRMNLICKVVDTLATATAHLRSTSGADGT